MKANKIYLLKFTKTVNVEDGDEFTHPIYNDLSNCLNADEQKYLGFADNEDIFIRLVDYKVSLVSNIFTKYGFEFDVIDVTSSVIKGDIQKEYPEVEKLTPYLFEDFRIDTTSVDDILDKINEKGMDSLDNIDKKILKIA
jgi:hypothetical protein